MSKRNRASYETSQAAITDEKVREIAAALRYRFYSLPGDTILGVPLQDLVCATLDEAGLSIENYPKKTV